MRLSSGDLVVGYPALKVRALLRACGSGTTAEFIARRLRVPLTEARKVLRKLVAEGLLEQDLTFHHRGDEPVFSRTLKGGSLAQATAAKPLRRATVDQKLRELVARMVEVNVSDDFLLGVEEAFVYGSYLTDAEDLGDLDVSLSLYRKESDGERYGALTLQRARASGRRFGSFIDELHWPQTHVLLFLKQRSRVFSLHLDEPLLLQTNVARRAVFLKRRPVMPKAGDGRALPARARHRTAP